MVEIKIAPPYFEEIKYAMIKSVWKPEEEIRASLEGIDNIALVSCAVCANLSGTGGHKGLKTMKGLAKKWGKNVVASQCVVACCSAEIMAQAVRIHIRPIEEKCGALVMLSCAGGVKSAYLSRPGMPVVAALDSVGSAVITRMEDPITQSMCVGCGHCVLSYTGGICPVSKCPAQRRYSPCKKSPVEGDACGVDPARKCVWKEIEKRGNLKALEELGRMHKMEQARIAPNETAPYPNMWRAVSGWAMARGGGLAWIFHSMM